MLSYTELAVTASEAADYLGAAGTAITIRETDLMRGQRYLAARFNSRWKTAFENADAPDVVRFAIIEAAALEAAKPGFLSPVSTPATDKVLVQAGKLQWERIGDASAPDAYVPRLSAVDGLLAGLLRSDVAFGMVRSIG